jgi:hypothetical protein
MKLQSWAICVSLIFSFSHSTLAEDRDVIPETAPCPGAFCGGGGGYGFSASLEVERPAPLVTLPTGDQTYTTKKIASVIAASCDLDARNDLAGEIRATCADESMRKIGEVDKILVWLERDFRTPGTVLHIYFKYLRLQSVLGDSTSISAFEPEPGKDSPLIKNLKNSLVGLAK